MHNQKRACCSEHTVQRLWMNRRNVSEWGQENGVAIQLRHYTLLLPLRSWRREMHFFFSLGFSSCTFFGVGGIAEWNKDDTQLLRIYADFFSFAPGLSSWLILNEIKHIALFFCPGSDWMNRRHVHFWMRSEKWSSKTTLYFYQVGDHGEQTKPTNTKYACSFALGFSKKMFVDQMLYSSGTVELRILRKYIS